MITQRFRTQEEKEEYRKLPPNFEWERVIEKLANEKSFLLLKQFHSLERSFALLVCHWIWLSENQEVRKREHKKYLWYMQKIFSFDMTVQLVKELVEQWNLLEVEDRIMVDFPSYIKITEPVHYLDAVKKCFQYRNRLAHEWYIFFMRKTDSWFQPIPIIESTNAMNENGLPNISLLLDTTIDEKGTMLQQSFVDFVHNLWLWLPPLWLTKMRYEVNKDKMTSLHTTLENSITTIEKTFKSITNGKIKKIQKMKKDVVLDYW